MCLQNPGGTDHILGSGFLLKWCIVVEKDCCRWSEEDPIGYRELVRTLASPRLESVPKTRRVGRRELRSQVETSATGGQGQGGIAPAEPAMLSEAKQHRPLSNRTSLN